MDEVEEKDIDLEPGAVILSEKIISLLDLMYDDLLLVEGESIEVSALFVDIWESRTVTINVRPQLEEIEVAGTSQPVFVCDVTLPDEEVHYVTADGSLVKIERPEQNVTIELSDN